MSLSRKVSFLLAGLALVSAASVQAAPYKAIIYPNSAKVWESSQFDTQTDKRGAFIEITLPYSVDPDSLVAQLESTTHQISNLAWEERSSEPAAEIKKLKQQLEEVKAKKRPVESKIQALNARIQFWNSQTTFQAKEYATIKQMAETLSIEIEQSQTLLKEQALLDRDLQEEINDLQRRIQQMTNNAEKTRVVRLSLANTSTKTNRLTALYSYTLQGSGWTSNYRIEGLPEKKQVLFNWESTVWQRSGLDWTNVDLSIATLQQRVSVIPPVMPEWVIYPKTDDDIVALHQPRNFMYAESAAMAPMSRSKGLDLPMEATEERKGAYSIWHLGKQNLPAGVETTLHVQTEQWPAKFSHLVRPGLGDIAFIEAEVEFDVSKDIPYGQSILLLDGSVIGKQSFVLNDNKATLYFGEDPFVTSEIKTVERATGKRGLLGGQQSMVIALKTTLRNTHPFPVILRVEEPKPMIKSEQVQLSTTFKPEPTKTDEALYTWQVELPARGEKVIDTKFEFKAPKDMDMSWGWR